MRTRNRATRSAGNRAARRTLVTAIIALAAVFTSVGIAQAGQSGPGIWVYNKTWSLTVYNLTNYNLKIIYNDAHEAGGCEPGGTGNYPFQNLESYSSGVRPYRTYQETLGHGCNLAPLHYYGCTVFQVQSPDITGLKNWAFEVCFEAQKADGLLEMGTWIYLKQHGTQSWSPPNAKAYGRWATPINESPPKMHNIMTLIGPSMMAAVYSTNNKGIVIMVQQYWDSPNGWDDRSTYYGESLDFVDNASSSVPGQ